MLRDWYVFFTPRALVLAAVVCCATALMFGAVPTHANAAATPQPTDTPIPPLTLYPRLGNPNDSDVKPRGPGLLLMGGGDTVDAAFLWMHDTIAGSRAASGGDVIVLRASGENAYDDYLMKLAHWNSVRSVVIGRAATAADLARVAAMVDHCQGVFFAGGDQANYARWKGTTLIAAVQRVYDRGGVVGGTSAGLAIQGEYAYDSVAADAAGENVEVTSKNAVADPAEPIISFTHDLLIYPALRGIITDTHFHQRDRLGRLAAFLAILRRDHPSQRLMGVGIDAASALVVDKDGVATLKLQGKGGSAIFLQGGEPQPIVAHRPLIFRNIGVTLLNQDGQTFDFHRWCADALHYTITVDGTKSPVYAPADPYHAPATASMNHCHA